MLYPLGVNVVIDMLVVNSPLCLRVGLRFPDLLESSKFTIGSSMISGGGGDNVLEERVLLDGREFFFRTGVGLAT